MGNLVRASSEEASKSKSSQVKPLTVHEIFGNVFVFNFAGHDTTAISLAYALVLLVSRPDIQDWIFEALNFYLPSSSAADWQYEAVFPNLKRCLAVLVSALFSSSTTPPSDPQLIKCTQLETLRLYNPLPGVPKYTSTPQSLKIASRTISIPADTLVIPALQTLHTHPRYWGKDSLAWQPKRWILNTSSTSPICQLACRKHSR